MAASLLSDIEAALNTIGGELTVLGVFAKSSALALEFLKLRAAISHLAGDEIEARFWEARVNALSQANPVNSPED